jgi:transcriptional regulator with XRE-family HTH domain
LTGAELREIRLRLGLTQKAMGKLVGVSRLTINRWERGIQKIREPFARLIAREIAPRTRRKRKR